MALQWSDFPSGQPGIYGTDFANALDGTPWVAQQNAAIVADPDAANFPNGNVLRHSSAADGPEAACRLALETPDAEVGVELRFYVAALPAESRCFLTGNTTGNIARYNLVLMPNGAIRLHLGS